MNLKSYLRKALIIFLFFGILFVTYNRIYAKDLIYKATITPDEDGNFENGSLTFRKYVRRFGSNPLDTPWSYSNKQLKSQFTNGNGSYNTQAMVFHKNYGTYYEDSWDGSANLLEVRNDVNTVPIDTSVDVTTETETFFNKYGITAQDDARCKTFIRLNNGSRGKVGDASYGNIYQSGDIYILRERTKDKMAITDFSLVGSDFTNFMDALKNNITPGADGNYEIRVSGAIQVCESGTGTIYGDISHADGTTNERYMQVDTAQQMFDVMMSDRSNAYNENGSIKSDWSGNDFGYNVTTEDRVPVEGHSVLNNFDNILKVPTIDRVKRYAYVKHVLVRDGVYDLAWDNQYLELNGLRCEPDIDYTKWMEKYNIPVESTFESKAINTKEGGNIKFKNGLIVKLKAIKATKISSVLGNLTEDEARILDLNSSEGFQDVSREGFTVPAGEDNYGIVYYYEPVSIEEGQFSAIVSHLVYNDSTKNISSLSSLTWSSIIPSFITKERATLYKYRSGSTTVDTSTANSSAVSKQNNTTYSTDSYIGNDYDTLAISPADTTGTDYKLVGYKVSYGNTYEEAANNLARSPYYSFDSSRSTLVKYFDKGKKGYIFFYYEQKSPPPPPGPSIEPFETDVYLDHINTNNSEYKNATDNEYNNVVSAKYNESMFTNTNLANTADVLPTGGTFTSYLRAAPYILKAAKIEEQKVSGREGVTGCIIFRTLSTTGRRK